MIRDLIGWAYRTPRWVVSLVCVYAAGLLFVGAVAHLTDLLRHGLRLDWAPDWRNWYRSSLAVLDPFAAWLLLRGRRGGVTLACAIMAADLAANWYAIYGIPHSHFVAEPDLQRLTGFAVLILGTAPFIRRHLADRDDLLPVTERDESTYQGETWILDSPEGVCTGQVQFEYPATFVLFSKFGPDGRTRPARTAVRTVASRKLMSQHQRRRYVLRDPELITGCRVQASARSVPRSLLRWRHTVAAAHEHLPEASRPGYSDCRS